MQYYPQNGYFPQPQYVPQPGAYITHYAAAPNVGPPPGVAQPFPAYPQDNYDRFTPSTHHPAPRPKFLQRSQSAAVPNPKAVPLRSAMKKGRHDRSYSQSAVPPSGPVVPTLSRTSSRGHPEQRERANSTGRRRTDSISQTFVPSESASQSPVVLLRVLMLSNRPPLSYLSKQQRYPSGEYRVQIAH